MKTTAYLRLSLLIPFLVWMVCLLFYLILSASPVNELVSGEFTTIRDFILLCLAFYVIGIILWIFPYLLLSLLLLLWSFKSPAQTAMKVFALSPIAMTILTILAANLLTYGSNGGETILPNPDISYQDFASFNLLLAIAILLCGYICVSIGWGTYKLFQRLQIIRDKNNSQLAPSSTM